MTSPKSISSKKTAANASPSTPLMKAKSKGEMSMLEASLKSKKTWDTSARNSVNLENMSFEEQTDIAIARSKKTAVPWKQDECTPGGLIDN